MKFSLPCLLVKVAALRLNKRHLFLAGALRIGDNPRSAKIANEEMTKPLVSLSQNLPRARLAL
jgi:hypothetical protein